MHYRRDELAIVLGSDNKLYAIGGFGGINTDDNSCLNTCERFNPEIG